MCSEILCTEETSLVWEESQPSEWVTSSEITMLHAVKFKYTDSHGMNPLLVKEFTQFTDFWSIHNYWINSTISILCFLSLVLYYIKFTMFLSLMNIEIIYYFIKTELEECEQESKDGFP